MEYVKLRQQVVEAVWNGESQWHLQVNSHVSYAICPRSAEKVKTDVYIRADQRSRQQLGLLGSLQRSDFCHRRLERLEVAGHPRPG